MTGAFSLVTRRQWQRHKLRLALTVLGIALGVAVFFAIRSTNGTLTNSLNATIEKLAGKATLQVAGGDAGFSKDIVKTVRGTKGVITAEPVTETLANTVTPAGEKLLILGLDTGSELKIYSDLFDKGDFVVKNPLAFTSRQDSIAVTRKFADRFGLRDGDKITLQTQGATNEFTIRGLFNSEGAGDVFDGNVAVMDIYSAQAMFGKGSRIDRIDLMTDPALGEQAVADALSSQLPAGIKVLRPNLRGQVLENAVSSMHFGLTIMSFLALTICGFIIFNSFTVSLNQRWKEIGIMRAIGATRRGIWQMFLGEALIVGVVGSIVGVGLGFLLAIVSSRVVTRVSETVYGIAASPQDLHFNWTFALQAFAVGVVISLIAAWFPALAAARLRPILALTNVEVRQLETGLSRIRIAFGIAFVVFGLLLIRFSTPQVGVMLQLFYSLILQVGMILLLPLFIYIGARVLRSPMRLLFGIEGVIAVETMAASPRRTVSTVGALMIGLSFVLANGALIYSQKQALDRSIDKALGAEILVTSSEQLHSRTYHFSNETAERIVSLPEVQMADALRVSSVEYAGEEVSILAHEMDAYFAISPDLLDSGDAAYARQKTAAGEGVLISNNLGLRWNLGIGDTISINSPTGELKLPIVGMLDYFRSEKGTIFLDRKLYRDHWNDTDVDYVFLDLKPGTDRSAFKQKVQTLLAGQQAFIYTHEEYRAWVMKLIDAFFALTYLQMFIAVFVAAIGLANTMLISVAERRREIGIFRAIGGLRSQVIKLILLEAICIALIGLVTGAITGLFSAYFLVHTAAKVVAGFTINLVYPYSILIAAVPMVLLIAAAAAFPPALGAAKIRIAEAIGYE